MTKRLRKLQIWFCTDIRISKRNDKKCMENRRKKLSGNFDGSNGSTDSAVKRKYSGLDFQLKVEFKSFITVMDFVSD